MFEGFTGLLLRPGDDGYDEARRVWNGAVDRRPAFVARCLSTADVVAAIRFGVRHGLTIAVRGGGHSIPGHSVCEGGLVVDLSPMKSIRVEGRVVQVGPGVLWRELDAVTEAHGLAVPGGEISDTGVAGLTLGGGIGWLSRKYGLACDNLVAARVVTADGTVLDVSEDDHADLLWGLRGGGGNFGVVTRFTFRLNPIPVPLFAGMAMHPLDREPLRAFFDLAAHAPDDLGLNAALITAPPEPFVPAELRGRPVVVLAAGYLGPYGEGVELTRTLREGAHLDTFGALRYTALQSMADAATPPGLAAHVRSEWLGPMSGDAVDALVEAAERMTSPLNQTLVRIMGGAIARVPPDSTAFRFREAAAMLTLAALWSDSSDDGEPHRAWARSAWTALRPWSAGGAYVNHLDDEGRARVREAYGTETWAKLVDLKTRYDPTNVFHHNNNVPPRRTQRPE